MSLKLYGSDLYDLFDTVMDRMINYSTFWDATQTPRILSYDNLLTAGSLYFADFDLSVVGFTKTRWARYVHQYINQDELKLWLDELVFISKRGENLFRTKDTVRRPREHRHGSCWLGLSYRNTPPNLTLYSRVAEFPTRGALELTMLTKVGDEIQQRLGVGPIHLTWFISSLFLSCLHLLPYLKRRGELEVIYARKDTVGEFVRHQVDHIAKGNVKYGPTKRMDKRMKQIDAGTVKLVPIRDLSLWI